MSEIQTAQPEAVARQEAKPVQAAPQAPQAGSGLQAVTFQLFDAVPPRRMYQLQQGIESEDRRRLFNRVEPDLDRGLGQCWLREERLAAIVRDSLLHYHRQRYRMHAWVIMPNHVHCLMEPLGGYSLGRLVGAIKGFSAGQINKLMQRSGKVWLDGSFLSRIKHEEHFDAAVEYIHNNPVSAGLCAHAHEWRWSSAAELPASALAGAQTKV
ncbi:MAG: transposase [Planctomycetales bacterium]|nr:transposase [bacterium]UNM09773.1 MAG: transposase [Planctomycetales bacterium]